MSLTTQRFDFESMLELLKPGKMIEDVHEHFQCSAEYSQRCVDAAVKFTEYLFSKLDKWKESRTAKYDLAGFLAKYFELIDEYAKPQSINEVAFASYIAGKMIAGIDDTIKKYFMAQATSGILGIITASIRRGDKDNAVS
jgi:hypothetical protein